MPALKLGGLSTDKYFLGATKSLSGFFCMCYEAIKLAPRAWTGLSSVLKDLRIVEGSRVP